MSRSLELSPIQKYWIAKTVRSALLRSVLRTVGVLVVLGMAIVYWSHKDSFMPIPGLPRMIWLGFLWLAFAATVLPAIVVYRDMKTLHSVLVQSIRIARSLQADPDHAIPEIRYLSMDFGGWWLNILGPQQKRPRLPTGTSPAVTVSITTEDNKETPIAPISTTFLYRKRRRVDTPVTVELIGLDLEDYRKLKPDDAYIHQAAANEANHDQS